MIDTIARMATIAALERAKAANRKAMSLIRALRDGATGDHVLVPALVGMNNVDHGLIALLGDDGLTAIDAKKLKGHAIHMDSVVFYHMLRANMIEYIDGNPTLLGVRVAVSDKHLP